MLCIYTYYRSLPVSYGEKIRIYCIYIYIHILGYKSNTIPVFQSDGQLLTYRDAGGQVMVDRKANILFELVEGAVVDGEG